MANHRLECGVRHCLDLCGCWCHRRCLAEMPRTRTKCRRLVGHGGYHRSGYAMENERRATARARSAARAA